MVTLEQWLEARRLSRYLATFKENDIDLDILESLTEDDLHRLGVSLGDRKRILRGLRAETVNVPATKSAELLAHNIESATAQGERRQVTVLFCDLVGSTALSNTRDPEEYRSILTRYHETCIRSIQRYEGYVAQIQGDGVVAYFGYPLAHEGEAERAVRAAIHVIERLGTLEESLAGLLRVRIGIATGLVVVSHVLAPDKSAVGETPNLAARLQTLAQPGEIILSERSKLLAGGAFDYADCGLHTLKGIAQPTQVWRVTGMSAAASRFEAATRGQFMPMVGREQEIRFLLDRWELSRRGEGQVVLLEGPPGIGKSRMLRAFREALNAKLEMALSYQCSPYYSNSALYPIVDHLERTLGFASSDGVQDKLDKLEYRLIADLHYSRNECALIAHALSVPCEDHYGRLEMSPQRQKEETIRLLVDIVAGIAGMQATVILFEDAHWADPSTLEVLNALIDRTEALPLLILITFRPEFRPAWAGRGHVTPLALTRLSRAQSASIVLRVAGNKPVPTDLAAHIVDKTDGVPLFLEELTKSVLESNIVQELPDRYQYSGKAEKLAIPNTLRDSLMARLDRLIPIKEIAQIGSVLGREFSYELVREISPMGESHLNEALDKLVDSELVFRRGAPPRASYVFKHALIQDAAYDSLLRTKRQGLHAQIAGAIRAHFPAKAANEPELLAHHYTEAELYEQAVEYWITAGHRALERTALAEAVAHLTCALDVNARLPASLEQELRELDIRMLLGTAYLTFKGHAVPEVLDTLEPARQLALRHGQDDKLVPITFYLWMHYTARVQFKPGLRLAEELDELARSTRDSYAFIVARNVENMTHGWMGNFVRACEAARRGVQAYEPERHAPLVRVYNHDQKCGILSWAVHFLWFLGYPDQAQAAADEQVETARRLRHPFNLAFSLTTGCAALVLRGEFARARAWINEAEDLGSVNAITYITHFFAPFWRGNVRVLQGEFAEGYADVTAAWEFFSSSGGTLLAPLACSTRAAASMNLGRLEQARALLAEAVEFIDNTDHRMHEAEVHRLLGRYHRRLGDASAAEHSLNKALWVARCQKAKGWELRAAIDLAGLWRDMDKRREAYGLLAPVFDWFTEGLDTQDLRQAAALLTELA